MGQRGDTRGVPFADVRVEGLRPEERLRAGRRNGRRRRGVSLLASGAGTCAPTRAHTHTHVPAHMGYIHGRRRMYL